MKHLALLAFILAAFGSGACHHAGGKVPVDHPIYTYQAPETDDDSDVDEDDGGDDDTGGDEGVDE